MENSAFKKSITSGHEKPMCFRLFTGNQGVLKEFVWIVIERAFGACDDLKLSLKYPLSPLKSFNKV